MITINGITLPDELIWVDEYEWSTVKATTKRTVQGKHIVLRSLMPSDAGRSITLTSDNSWTSRLLIHELHLLSNEVDLSLFLQMHDGRSYLCKFRHWDPPCLQAELLVPTAFPEDETLYKLTLKLAVI
jgi:hypothetical protein